MHFRIPPKLLTLDEGAFGRTIDELVQNFGPEQLRQIGNERTQWEVKRGARRTGRVAYAVLHQVSETGETMLLCAIENDSATEHDHRNGEWSLTLAGEGNDWEDNGTPATLTRGDVIMHAPNLFHTPRATGFWVSLCYQPEGMRERGSFVF